MLLNLDATARDIACGRPEVECFEDAYKYFLDVAPSLDDHENRATRKTITRTDYDEKVSKKEVYIVIEERVHTPGYLDGDGTCAKRPRGAVIAATRIVCGVINC